jgi:hypothetical protein
MYKLYESAKGTGFQVIVTWPFAVIPVSPLGAFGTGSGVDENSDDSVLSPAVFTAVTTR